MFCKSGTMDAQRLFPHRGLVRWLPGQREWVLPRKRQFVLSVVMAAIFVYHCWCWADAVCEPYVDRV